MTKRTEKSRQKKYAICKENDHLIKEVAIAKLENFAFVAFTITLGSGKNDH